MNSYELVEWKRKVLLLHYYEYLIMSNYSAGKINKKEKEELKKVIDMHWIHIWQVHPDKNLPVENAFKLNFC